MRKFIQGAKGVLAGAGLFTLAACGQQVEDGLTCHQDGDGYLVTRNGAGKIHVLDGRYSWEKSADGRFCQGQNPVNGQPDIPFSEDSVSTPYSAIEEARERYGYDPAPEPEPGV